MKLRIDLLDLPSFYDVRWLTKTVLPCMITLQFFYSVNYSNSQNGYVMHVLIYRRHVYRTPKYHVTYRTSLIGSRIHECACRTWDDRFTPDRLIVYAWQILLLSWIHTITITLHELKRVLTKIYPINEKLNTAFCIPISLNTHETSLKGFVFHWEGCARHFTLETQGPALNYNLRMTKTSNYSYHSTFSILVNTRVTSRQR